MSSKKEDVNKFKAAVANTPNVKNAYRNGLQALGAHSSKIHLSNTSNCNGSVEIDEAVRLHYPEENRWDYCFSYNGEVFFVEVHTANTSEVDTVIRKLSWLKDWLHQKAPQINSLKAKSKPPFYWIQSNGFHILKNSRQYRRIAQEGIKPIAKLVL